MRMKGNFAGTGAVIGGKPLINQPFDSKSVPVAPLARPAPSAAGKNDAPAEPASIRMDSDRLRTAIALFGEAQWEDATREFMLVDSSALSLRERAELSYYLGLCHMKTGRHEDALPYIEKVLAAGGDILRAYQCRMTLAFIHVTEGRPKMAEQELRRLQDAGFESAQMFNAMAYAAYARKHYRHALEYYEKALGLDADNATALNSMGFILADTGIDPLRGLKLCRRAVELKPGSAAYLDSLGWACFKCSDPAAARSWLRKALEIAPREREIREHLRIAAGG